MAAFFLAVVGWLTSPVIARACACGAVVTTEQAVVNGETAVVRYSGGVESIDMSMRLSGSAADAAWIMPIPKGTEVSLGHADFDSLYEATKPETRQVYDWVPRFGSGARDSKAAGAGKDDPVRVDSVQQIGPFDVTTLSGTDPSAVGAWLVEHGYSKRSDLDQTFGLYLKQGFQILAVKLVPEGQYLDGDLAPLRMTFETDEAIYPILLSKHASTTQDIRLYLVSDHKMTVTREASLGQPLALRFAGKLPLSAVEPGLSGDGYVTLFTGRLVPRQIEADYAFGRAADDEPYREVRTITVYRGDTTMGIVAAVALFAGAVVVTLVVRRRARVRARA